MHTKVCFSVLSGEVVHPLTETTPITHMMEKSSNKCYNTLPTIRLIGVFCGRLWHWPIVQHRAAFGGGWERAGRFASRFEATYSPLSIVTGTVRLCWREVGAHNFGLPTLDRFPQFSAIARKWPLIGLQVTPKTAEIDQTWPFFLLPSSAVALLHYPQPSTKHTWALDRSPHAKR